MKKTIIEGNRAVVINGQGGNFWANLYVNARGGLNGADITTSMWTGKTAKGAEKWAAKMLAT